MAVFAQLECMTRTIKCEILQCMTFRLVSVGVLMLPIPASCLHQVLLALHQMLRLFETVF